MSGNLFSIAIFSFTGQILLVSGSIQWKNDITIDRVSHIHGCTTLDIILLYRTFRNHVVDLINNVPCVVIKPHRKATLQLLFYFTYIGVGIRCRECAWRGCTGRSFVKDKSRKHFHLQESTNYFYEKCFKSHKITLIAASTTKEQLDDAMHQVICEMMKYNRIYPAHSLFTLNEIHVTLRAPITHVPTNHIARKETSV